MEKRPSKPGPDTSRDEETGRFTERYPTAAFVEAIRNAGGDAGTQAVADEVGCSYETAYKKLQSLDDAGTIDHRQVGNAYLWEVTDE